MCLAATTSWSAATRRARCSRWWEPVRPDPAFRERVLPARSLNQPHGAAPEDAHADTEQDEGGETKKHVGPGFTKHRNQPCRKPVADVDQRRDDRRTDDPGADPHQTGRAIECH